MFGSRSCSAPNYGRVFVAKMAAVACLLALSALNRQRLTPRLDTTEGIVKLTLW